MPTNIIHVEVLFMGGDIVRVQGTTIIDILDRLRELVGEDHKPVIGIKVHDPRIGARNEGEA
jgi:hypothetical protein